MADPEKKKKLDEIKRKRKELMEQLKSSESKKAKDSKSIEQEARETLASAAKKKNPLETMGIEAQTDKIFSMMKKSRTENLEKTSFYEDFPSSKPEVYDEATQWRDLKNVDDEDSDNEVKEQLPSKPKQQLVIPKSKQVKNEVKQFGTDEKKYEVIHQEDKEEFLKASKDEINELLKNKKKLIERAVNERNVYDIFKRDDDELKKVYVPESQNLIEVIAEYNEKTICARRAVTSLDWSIKHPELFLASYSRTNDNPNEKNGLILVWSLSCKEEPEFKFICQPEVTSAIFHPYNPKLILGGTHTGQVLIWDTRGKQAPVYKTPLGLVGGQSGIKTHSSDITCLGVIGSTNSSHIMSLSNGALCLWSLNNLSNPVKRLELRISKQGEKDDLAELGVLSMGVQQYESNNILVGGDNNNIYQVSLNGGSDFINKDFKGHGGPIYSIDFHPSDNFNTCNFNHLFATTSADWTTKIWSKQKVDGALFTLENSNNYVYCCKWCPTNASILACCDGDGYLDIMDFNKDLESPKLHCKLGNDALNKLAWTEDGQRLAVGNSEGKIQLLGMDRHIYQSTSEASKKFERIIGKMK